MSVFNKTLLADDTPLVYDRTKTVKPNGKVVTATRDEVYINLRGGTIILSINGTWKWLPKD
jgi:hypothetical protein